MKHINFFLYLFIFFNISYIKSIDNECFFIDTDSLSYYSIYELSKNENEGDYVFETKKGTTIKFNFCSVLSNDKDVQVKEENGSNKLILSNSPPKDNKWKSYDDGVTIELVNGETCKSNPSEYYSIIYNIKCNEDIKDISYIDKSDFDKDICQKTLYIESKYGCPQLSIYNIYKFIHEKKIFFCITLLAIGIVLCFFGKKFIYATIFIFSSIICIFIIFMFVFNVVLPKGIEVDDTVLIIVLIVSFIPGIGIGFLIIKHQHFLLACILGGVSGFFLAIFVYDLLLNHLDFANKLLLKILVYVIVILICIGIGYLSIEHLKILATSFVGSYSIVRAPTLFLDKFPNETEMANYFTDDEKLRDLGDDKDVLVKLILFLICWIFFSILGIYVQYKMWDRKKDEDNDTSINSRGDPALAKFLDRKL